MFQQINLINRYKLQSGVLEIMKCLDKLDIKYCNDSSCFNIDDMENINMRAFESEEKRYGDKKNICFIIYFNSTD